VFIGCLVAGQSDCPKGFRDVAFVFEVPSVKAKREVADLKDLYVSLHKIDTEMRCIHYSLVLVEETIDVVQALDCQSKVCFDNALSELDKLSQKLSNEKTRE